MVSLIVCIVLIIVIVLLLIKIVLMRKSMGEIASSLDNILDGDTNAVITVSSVDGSIRKLAARLNKQLRGLRARRIRYENGDRELKEAVTNISHDLRTPLTSISGYLELLSQEEKSETVEKYLDIIDNRTQTLKELTEELFRYAVILAQDEITLETLDIKAVLEESILSFYVKRLQRNLILRKYDRIPEKLLRKLL